MNRSDYGMTTDLNDFDYRDPDSGQLTEHRIEESVVVYVTVRNGQWAIDPVNLDGYALDPRHDRGASTGECECGDPTACAVAKTAADKLPFPTGRDLALMLIDALTGGDGALDRTTPPDHPTTGEEPGER
jgi:hypothetical protein